jgi:hypothetical protein
MERPSFLCILDGIVGEDLLRVGKGRFDSDEGMVVRQAGHRFVEVPGYIGRDRQLSIRGQGTRG